MISCMFSAAYDSLLNKHGQFAAHRRARTDVQQKKLFQR